MMCDLLHIDLGDLDLEQVNGAKEAAAVVSIGGSSTH